MAINQVSGQTKAYVMPDVPHGGPKASAAEQRLTPAPAIEPAQEAATSGQTNGARFSPSQMEEILQRVKESLKPVSINNLEFSIDDTTGQTVVKVIDSSTKELIRQIPSEEMLAIARALEGEIKGMLVSNKV